MDQTTPVNSKKTKRLALKRNKCTSICGRAKDDAIPVKSTPEQSPHSDAKVNYNEISTPNTSTVQRRQSAASTNCRPFRLSLSKRVREKMTFRRLEFHLANEIEKDLESSTAIEELQNVEIIPKVPDNQVHKNSTEDRLRVEVNLEDSSMYSHNNQMQFNAMDSEDSLEKDIRCQSFQKELELIENTVYDGKTKDKCDIMKLSRNQLEAGIEQFRNELNSRQEHTKKVLELQEAIKVWKEGFCSALNDLREKTGATYETEVFLQKLGIPPDMSKYVND